MVVEFIIEASMYFSLRHVPAMIDGERWCNSKVSPLQPEDRGFEKNGLGRERERERERVRDRERSPNPDNRRQRRHYSDQNEES